MHYLTKEDLKGELGVGLKVTEQGRRFSNYVHLSTRNLGNIGKVKVLSYG
jgi:hypothetical protein